MEKVKVRRKQNLVDIGVQEGGGNWIEVLLGFIENHEGINLADDLIHDTELEVYNVDASDPDLILLKRNSTVIVTGNYTIPPLAAPINLTANYQDNHTIRLNWDDQSNDETHFEIQRSINGFDGWEKVGEVPENQIQFIDTLT